MNDWTTEEDNLLTTNYSFKKPKDLAPLFPNRTQSSIKNRAFTLKLKKKKIFTKDEAFFEIPNTINSSVAGMIASDGHLRPKSDRNTNSVKILLLDKDKEILEKILSATKSNTHICTFRSIAWVKTNPNKHYFNDKYFSSICIPQCDKWHSDIVKNWNIPIGRKSLIIEPPNITDLDICLAYIGGLINGDGSILVKKWKSDGTNKKLLDINLLGTKSLMDWCKIVIEKALGFKIKSVVKKAKKSEKIYCFRFVGRAAILLFEKINQLNIIKLDRKWNNPEVLEFVKNSKIKDAEFYENPLSFVLNGMINRYKISQFPAQSVIAAD